ncbi:N-acetyl-gamma-glutamyl-phosphate reductase [candidate division KSB3 bacterium]|uniref:N-acetyl-gamma-glutamyl-phosphate reductase n=1 Tax=candidate division KSB3 bacterium TaxID=2044937 RepID=A0A9D5JWP2_9BACT|nr:N-acetyl-gamma-glutamyl-phosphate reductase [candidate division KSB3 bacterium]MBD3325674.1 N-acetyl-gamma-glutamyl-phosphate reductase [candidate division KSB3 bacterium]
MPHHTPKKLRTAIIGASGYSGVELVKLLLDHPQVELTHVIGATTAGQRLDHLYPAFRTRTALEIEPYQFEAVKDMDVVFLALPHGEAMQRVPELAEAGIRVIDLSGDFRFKSAALYERWYKLPHTAPSYLAQAVYGLPELFRESIRDCRLLANPGCYPTGAILALAPILTQPYVALDSIAITALSGTSGAGKKAKVDLLFSEVNESVKAYRVGHHQHTPEIKAIVEHVAGRELNLAFVPHLLPITRGIYTTICLPLTQPVSLDAVVQTYQEFYRQAPFVRILADRPPEIKFVTGLNYCDIGIAIDATTRFVMITSAIDNLVKGAAGQAVQNMNLMAGFPEQEGL